MSGRRREPLSGQLGMTVVEVTIAALLLIMASLAAMQLIDAGRRNTLRAEGSQVAVNVAERELEAVRGLDYANVALSSMPATNASVDDPRHRVSGSTFALNKAGTGAASMVVDAGNGQVAPGPTPFTNGDVSGDLYRFVVWRDDPNIAGAQNYKRVIVAASVNASSITPERGYIEVQSDIVNPNDSTTNTSSPSSPGAESDEVSYWLSDTQTTAAATCNPTHIAPSTHATHNTTGNCGGASGPDYAFRTPPTSGSGTLPDYSNDVGGTSGLQLSTNSAITGGCNMSAGSTSVHRWVTPTLNLNVTRQAALTIYTRQPTATAQTGTICFSIVQTLNLGSLISTAKLYNAQTDALISNCSQVTTIVSAVPLRVTAQYVCTASAYPTTWTPLRIEVAYPIDINLVSNVTAALAVRAQQASPNGIQFMYDHPSYPSRLSFDPLL